MATARGALLVSLLALLLAGAAFAATPPSTTPAAQAADGDTVAMQDAPRRFDRNCLQRTGSRITAQANARADARKDDAPRRCAPHSGRSYSQDDLRSTGAIDIADALRRLDPAVN